MPIRLLSNGCHHLVFFLQNDVKITLPNHSHNTIHWFEFCKALSVWKGHMRSGRHRSCICSGSHLRTAYLMSHSFRWVTEPQECKSKLEASQFFFIFRHIVLANWPIISKENMSSNCAVNSHTVFSVLEYLSSPQICH